MSGTRPSAYRHAGVDQDAADALVGVFATLASRTRRAEVTDEVGSFAGLFSLEDLAERGYRRPALAVSTDGVGTKVELLQRTGRHAVAGWDVVAMNADDVVCCGAEPLLFVDYVSVDRLEASVVEAIVAGVADGCAAAGCALVGGETSQHPGLLPSGGYDVVGTCVGVVDLDRAWGPSRVRAGDAVVGLASSGPHANGFSLVRRLLGREEPWPELLEPTAIYARAILDVAAAGAEVHAAAHVTGGGIAGNLTRALPDGLGARIDRGAWPVPGVFERIASLGVSSEDMDATFNMGLGMLLVCPDPDEVVRRLADGGCVAWTVGRVVAEPGVRIAP